jgi:hypothetical protein
VLQVPRKSRVALEECCDVMEYYEALLRPTAHGAADPCPLANGYIWATQAMEGMTVAEVVAATARVYELGRGSEDVQIEVTPGKTIYPAPRFREAMVELIAELLRFKYEIWVVSASNVWSVRWMVLYGLNPLLRKHGVRRGLSPRHVIGVATLVMDPQERLFKDCLLLKEDAGYAALHHKSLKKTRLTRHLQFPVSVYSGKVACILDAIGRNPHFSAGDNPSDHPMMRISKHRLWIGRLEKPEAQRITSKLISQTGKGGWILQACSDFGGPRFLPELDGTLDLRNYSADSRRAAAILRRMERQLSAGQSPQQAAMKLS